MVWVLKFLVCSAHTFVYIILKNCTYTSNLKIKNLFYEIKWKIKGEKINSSIITTQNDKEKNFHSHSILGKIYIIVCNYFGISNKQSSYHNNINDNN